MRTSLVITIKNEAKTLPLLFNSLTHQVKHPNEIIITDGGSTDKSAKLVREFQKKFPKLHVKFFLKHGNRSVGRNYGITKAKGDLIMITDAGCILDAKWIFEMEKSFKERKTTVVAGYYKGIAKTVFEKCLIPYVLIMPDRIDPKKFLPASRSMAFRKTLWKKIGGFPESYSHNEDYVFAKNIEKMQIDIVFQKKALVFWMPPQGLKNSLVMFYRFAFGDAESGILRPKVFFLFLRYVIFSFLLLSLIHFKSQQILLLDLLIVFVYIAWSIIKNFRYVKALPGLYILPMLQISSDITIIVGTIFGLLRRKGVRQI